MMTAAQFPVFGAPTNQAASRLRDKLRMTFTEAPPSASLTGLAARTGFGADALL